MSNVFTPPAPGKVAVTAVGWILSHALMPLNKQLWTPSFAVYTAGLLRSIPRLDAVRGGQLTPIPGSASDTLPWERGCAFAPRCPAQQQDCLVPDLELTEEPR